MAKISFKDDIQCIKRAAKIWQGYAPKYWRFAISLGIIDRCASYFTLAMSALLLDEISGNRDLNRLILFTVLTVFGGFIISVVTRVLHYKKAVLDGQHWRSFYHILFDADCHLQYEHTEDPNITLMKHKIETNANAIWGGLLGSINLIPSLVMDLVDLILSMSLTMTALFMSASGQFSGIMGFINSPLSAVVMLLFIAAFVMASSKLRYTRRSLEEDARGEVSLLNRQYNAYGSLWGPDMTIFNLHPIVLQEYRKNTLRPSWLLKMQKISLKFTSIDAPKNMLLQIIVHLYVAAKAFAGACGIGSFVMYQGAIIRFVRAFDSFAGTLAEIRFNTSYLQLTYQYFDLPNDMYKGTLAVEKRDDLDYEIEFRDVSFKYPRTDTWSLRHVSMKFKIGDKIAIVGENGSGKTTFIKLLCRLYDPTEGKILLNGIDITKYRYNEYIGLFSVVFQDFNLFNFSLGDNVSAGSGYDEAKARDCLERAGMGNKLAQLDKKAKEDGKNALDYCNGREYDIDGIEFSGGEQQKIALARALYKDAPFVILDEPTANLDPIAEAAVYENFNTISKDRTSVFISHRLSSCRFCERILVFDKGSIVQEGSHDELVKKEGKYKSLWAAQAKYYVKKE